MNYTKFNVFFAFIIMFLCIISCWILSNFVSFKWIWIFAYLTWIYHGIDIFSTEMWMQRVSFFGGLFSSSIFFLADFRYYNRESLWIITKASRLKWMSFLCRYCHRWENFIYDYVSMITLLKWLANENNFHNNQR